MENSISRQNVDVNVRAVVTDSNVTVQYKTKILQKNVVGGVNTLVPAMISEANVKYVIKYDFDLEGESITIPENCVLEFDGGSLSDGLLSGQNTIIKAYPNITIFDNVDFSGEWVVPNIYVDWIKLDETTNADNRVPIYNILKLQSDEVYNTIYFPNKELCFLPLSTYNESYLIRATSNTHIIIPNTIKVLANDLSQYHVVFIAGSENSKIQNVTVDGGGTLIGDVETHTGNTGDSGMGVSIYYGKDITIKDITCKKFWGDGFYLGGGVEDSLYSYDKGCINIRYSNIHADSNRRQGMSLTCAIDNVVIENSSFTNTGAIKYTAPGCGIDIESNGQNTCAVSNLLIDNCIFKGNHVEGLRFDNKYFENDIIVRNSIFHGKEHVIENETFIGGMSLKFRVFSGNINIDGCTINAPHLFEGYTDAQGSAEIMINNCVLRSGVFQYGTSSNKKIGKATYNSCKIIGGEIKYDGYTGGIFPAFYIMHTNADMFFSKCDIISTHNVYDHMFEVAGVGYGQIMEAEDCYIDLVDEVSPFSKVINSTLRFGNKRYYDRGRIVYNNMIIYNNVIYKNNIINFYFTSTPSCMMLWLPNSEVSTVEFENNTISSNYDALPAMIDTHSSEFHIRFIKNNFIKYFNEAQIYDHGASFMRYGTAASRKYSAYMDDVKDNTISQIRSNGNAGWYKVMNISNDNISAKLSSIIYTKNVESVYSIEKRTNSDLIITQVSGYEMTNISEFKMIDNTLYAKSANATSSFFLVRTILLNTRYNAPMEFIGSTLPSGTEKTIVSIKNVGEFSAKPDAQYIYVGFKYFCTDRQTAEGATNGIEIIHKGNNVWIDALGRVVS